MNAMHEDMQVLVWRTFKFSNDLGSAMRRKCLPRGASNQAQRLSPHVAASPEPSDEEK
jgi:hypothetical protein